jgi:hypothetical protein
MKLIKLDAIDSTNDFLKVYQTSRWKTLQLLLKIKLKGRDKWDQYGTLRWVRI